MSNPLQDIQAASRFWTEFQQQSDELYDLAFAGQGVVVRQRIKELAVHHGSSFVVELTSKGKTLVLIFSPECDPTLAKQIDEFVSYSPPLDKWLVYGRRQQKPVEAALKLLQLAFHVAADDAAFEFADDGESVRVRMYTSAHERVAVSDRADYVRFFLAHAIGEDRTMRLVGEAQLLPPDSQQRLSPVDLVESFERREQ